MSMSTSELLLLPINTVLGGKKRRDNIPYGPGDHMAYDEYPSTTSAAPLVIFWYGGGWKNGRKEMYRFVGHALQQMGAHAFVLDYPKYPVRTYPGFLDDAVAAVTNIKGRHPGRKIILMGHSAGGHTALLLGLRRLVQVDSAVTISAPCTINERYWRPVFGDAIKKGLTDPRNYVEGSPRDLSTLLIHGSKDTTVNVHDSVTLHEKLQAHGRKSQLDILNNLDHMLILPLIMLGLVPGVRKRLARHLERYAN